MGDTLRLAKSPRILVITSRFSYDGESPWLVDDLVAEMLKRGAFVDVIIQDVSEPRPRGITAPQGSRLRTLSVGVKKRKPGSMRPLARVWSALRMRVQAPGFLNSRRYDVLIYFSPAFLSAGFPGRLRRKGRVAHLLFILWDFFPVHHHEIGRISWKWVLPPLKLLERMAMRRADTIGVMSPANGEYLRRYHRRLRAGVAVIPPWGGSGPLPAMKVESFQAFTVVFGGQLAAGRGIDTLIDAAELLAQAQDPIEIKIIGSGPDAGELKARAAKRRLPVEFIGRVPRHEYLRLLQRAHVGVAITVAAVSVPTYPSKIVDYCRVGLPVVVALEECSDAGSEIAVTGAGLSVEAGNAGALAQALRQLHREWLTGKLATRSAAAERFYANHLSSKVACDIVYAAAMQSNGTRLQRGHHGATLQ